MSCWGLLTFSKARSDGLAGSGNERRIKEAGLGLVNCVEVGSFWRLIVH
jgi:hypothetical protein